MIKNKQKGFALVLSLILLLAMSLMGGALIVIASSDHQGNNSSDEYQQTFYVAETALMEAEKSLVNKMIGPINNVSGIRDFSGRFIPRNQELTDPAPNQTPCYKSFRNLSRDADFRVVEQLENQSFFSLIEPIFDDTNFALVPTIDTTDAIDDEREKLGKFRYEFFSINSGTASYKAAGISLKKTSGASQRLGTAYRIYGCGMMGDVENPEILIPLETIIVLSH
tara:strand:- start:70 stop:741 length:672 start_codon:yes stop_codon:yes gene_type:complete